MRGIIKAVALENACIFSGPNGNLRFWCFNGTRGDFDAEFFTLISPISVLETRELWVGRNAKSHIGGSPKPWNQTVAGIRGVFGVLTKVEDLTIDSCNTVPIFIMLCQNEAGSIPLPGLRRSTIYVGCGDLDSRLLVECAKARKEHSRPLGEIAIIFESKPEAKVTRELESLREFVEELDYHAGVTPVTRWWDSHDGEMR